MSLLTLWVRCVYEGLPLAIFKFLPRIKITTKILIGKKSDDLYRSTNSLIDKKVLIHRNICSSTKIALTRSLHRLLAATSKQGRVDRLHKHQRVRGCRYFACLNYVVGARDQKVRSLLSGGGVNQIF